MKRFLSRSVFPVLLVMVFVLPGLASACGGGSGAPPAASTSSKPVAGNSVTISNFAFSPATVTVAVGTTVTWTNKDSVAHTVTSDTGAFDSGNLSPNGTYSYKFTTSGTFPYHCGIHTYMKGTVIVQ